MDFNFIGTVWSLLLPVVAIALALKTKDVYSSLFIGIVLGAILYSMSMGTGTSWGTFGILIPTSFTPTVPNSYGTLICLAISSTVICLI